MSLAGRYVLEHRPAEIPRLAKPVWEVELNNSIPRGGGGTGLRFAFITPADLPARMWISERGKRS
jgi:hypothetical protein